MKKHSLIYGVGINDAPEPISFTDKQTGKVTYAPEYQRWKAMINRCYSPKSGSNAWYLDKQVTVCEEWKRYSGFLAWLKAQAWHDRELDKDIVGDGTEYAPGKAFFVPKAINYFFVIGAEKPGDLPLGATKEKARSHYAAFVREGNRSRFLGRHETPMQAHAAWKAAKLAHGQALIERYQATEHACVISAMKAHLSRLAQQIKTGTQTRSLLYQEAITHA